MSEKYQPANGTEGMAFFDRWCTHCAKDQEMNGSKSTDECGDGDWCPIIGASMRLKPTDPDYPAEWTYDEKGAPVCTAFVEVGSPEVTARCEHTTDMFGGKS